MNQNETKKLEEKIKKKNQYIKQIHVNIIFSNMKQYDLLVRAFILVKLI